MTNADLFKRIFGMYAEEFWSYTETEMLKWINADVPDRKVGKWTEKEVIHADEAKEIITEWQSCKCSVCGRYDTRPYLYYFNEPRFCSWCGERMKGVRK